MMSMNGAANYFTFDGNYNAILILPPSFIMLIISANPLAYQNGS